MAGVPVSERRLDAAGVSTALFEGGDGPPIVLLHGGIECGGAYWAPVAATLAKSHRLVIPDVPGLGESRPVERLDAEVFADWMVALLAAARAERPILVAHSLLGTLAARFAARRPGLLRRLVIYGSPGVGRYRMPLGLRVVAVRFGLRPTERNSERFERWAFHDRDGARAQDPDWFRAWSEYTRSRALVPHVKRAMRQLIAAGTKRVPDSELGCISEPADLLWGGQDRFVSLGVAESAHARLSWPLHVIEEAGHVPHIERPEAFLQALDAALEAGHGGQLTPRRPRLPPPASAPAAEASARTSDR
jgi:2-hydroxymuconate-semialdehyde hydrolase